MENDGGMEEKDLAIQEQIVENLEEQLSEWIKEKKEGTFILEYGQFPTEMTMQKDEKNGYSLICFGRAVLVIDENNQITYNKEALNELKQFMDENSNLPYEELGLPDADYIAYLEKEKEKEEDGNREKTDEEAEEELEEEKGEDPEEKAFEDVAEETGRSVDEIRASSIRLSNTKTIDGRETIKQKIPGANKYASIVAIPKEGAVTGFEYRGLTNEGKLEELQLNESRYGTNPSEEIILLNGDEVSTVVLTDIYEIQDGDSRGRIGTCMRCTWNKRNSVF